ncbi:MAG: octaprenyl diphosphate synthase [Gammaproteobacteria bacterium]|jgi:octaprenyl-diphosphate synthase|nr:octaprenyl diphosphate synthase [Gammaproteobacteria bacterium]MDH3407012.1 octaprenyl diphosphate synthase [Gammaproteobacteria bacterium]MDH5487754.1 octaprenyl diphosphate synthase [Gammaproteobacteria bacterium]
MDYEAIKALVRDDLRAVDREIEARLQSDVALINQMGSYIVQSGGKRLRPVLVLLGSRAFGYQGHDHIRLAAIIEFIHTATLLHDDVVDASELRRGHTTANTIWGNEASVLVGDFLYSRAFEMMVEVGSMRVMEILAHTTNTIAKGEVMQLLNCHDPETTEERYIEVIRSKTAKLFQAGAQLSAVISGQNRQIEEDMATFGMHIGTAFQLVDDALDYGRENHELGKNIGDDLAEGKPTLPLIYTLRQGNTRQRDLIRTAIEEGGLEQMEEVMDAIESTGSITYTARRAEDEASRATAALAAIPDSPFKQALLDLAHFSAHRSY